MIRGVELLLFPSRVLTRSGSADPELTVSAWRNVRARHSDKIPAHKSQSLLTIRPASLTPRRFVSIAAQMSQKRCSGPALSQARGIRTIGGGRRGKTPPLGTPTPFESTGLQGKTGCPGLRRRRKAHPGTPCNYHDRRRFQTGCHKKT